MISNSISLKNNLAARWETIAPAWRWAISVFLAARILYTAWSLVILLLVPSVLQNLDLFGTPVVVAFDLNTGGRRVFSRVVNGQPLNFQKTDAQHMSDTQTGSLWLLNTGRAVSGAYAGISLNRAAYTEDAVFPYHGVKAEGGWFGIWQRFDVLQYQAIVEQGYSANGGDIHFPPLYPTLERILGTLLGGNFFLAGWLISQSALVGGLGLLYQLTEQWRDANTARRAVVLLVLFPTAFFFFTAYAESLFLLLVLLCFAALHRERWTIAGLWAFLAILTRLQGVALLIPLAYCAWQSFQTRRQLKSFPIAELSMLVLPCLAGAFYLLLRAMVGGGNIVPTSEPQLNARLVLPWDNLIYAVQTISSGRFLVADLLNFGTTLLAILILLRGGRTLPPSYNLYAAATLIVVAARWVDTQPLNSMMRYVLGAFPLFMLLAAWSKHRWVERALAYSFVPLNLYLCAQFLLWGWVA
ncbi:MAG TPA: hypothetical protein VFD70_04870 [Anaerolineae bacterium]|nr:hypothetical protein [Anaerolineae bacterium]